MRLAVLSQGLLPPDTAAGKKYGAEIAEWVGSLPSLEAFLKLLAGFVVWVLESAGRSDSPCSHLPPFAGREATVLGKVSGHAFQCVLAFGCWVLAFCC